MGDPLLGSVSAATKEEAECKAASLGIGSFHQAGLWATPLIEADFQAMSHQEQARHFAKV